MKIRNVLLAAAATALVTPAAFAATTMTKDTCSEALKKADAALAAHSKASTKAHDMRNEGEKLCQSGKEADGVKKLEAAAKEADKAK